MPTDAARSRQSQHDNAERRDPLNGHPEIVATCVPSRTLLYLNRAATADPIEAVPATAATRNDPECA